MLKLFNFSGDFKLPAKAIRTHGNEFLVYQTDFVSDEWDDIYKTRLAIFTVRPHRNYLKDFEALMVGQGLSDTYVLVEVIT